MSSREVAAAEIVDALGLIGALEGALVVRDESAARRTIERLRAMLAGWGGREARADAG